MNQEDDYDDTLGDDEWTTPGGGSTNGAQAAARAEELGITHCPHCRAPTSSIQTMNEKLVRIVIWFAIRADEVGEQFVNWRNNPPSWMPDGYMPPVLRHFGLLEQEVRISVGKDGIAKERRVKGSYRITRSGLDFLNQTGTTKEHVRIDSRKKERCIERFGRTMKVADVLGRRFDLSAAKEEIKYLNFVRHVRNSVDQGKFLAYVPKNKK